MLINRDTLPQHRAWIIVSLAVFIVATLAYAGAAWNMGGWPGGSSLVGFIDGVVGGLIILFECFLWVRKRYLRVWRIGRTQVWLRVHIWLGLLCLPLLIYHSGFRWGGTLSTVLMALLIIVVASGVFGLVLQNLVPQKMLEEVPAETIYSQIEHVMKQSTRDADRLVRATCGADEGDERRLGIDEAVDEEESGRPEGEPLTIGAVRTVGNVQGKVLQTVVAPAPVTGAEPLWPFFVQYVRPYLRGKASAGSPMRSAQRSAVVFEDLRTKLPIEAHPVVGELERLCSERRQLDWQAQLHFWLHSWLWVHLPLSAALLVLMIVHAVYAIRYW